MGLFKKFLAKVTRTSDVTTADWDELYIDLVSSDLGAGLAKQIIEVAKKSKLEEPVAAIHDSLCQLLSKKPRTILKSEIGLTTILVIGVNGTGKTTSVAKLANQLLQTDATVLLGAADTFRAAAVAQLQTWGSGTGIPVVTGKANSEPAAVAFDSVTQALAGGYEYLVIDTAGRLQNKADLMAELGKIKRVCEKISKVNEVLLVIDATTGQNGLSQAKLFAEAVEVTGIILTKLDGSARGGIALAIENELDIPIKFLGMGESVEDIALFDQNTYLAGILGE
jgi:fused signal recognition particle receptor